MKNKYIFQNETITAIKQEESNNYLWIATVDASNQIHLYMTSSFNPEVIYYDVDNIIGDSIQSIMIIGSYLYLALDSSQYIGLRVNRTSPIINQTYIDSPSGINEGSIDFVSDGTYIYFLTPGIASGEYSKVAKIGLSSLAYVETIDLSSSGDEVTDAKKIDIDDENNLWIVSQLTIPILTKVWLESGDVWIFVSYDLSE